MAIHREMTLSMRARRWLVRRWNLNLLLGAISLTACALVWQFAMPLGLPFLHKLPPITDVIRGAADLVTSKQYADGWLLSMRRIMLGFLTAQLIGIPLGLAMAMSRIGFY